MSSIIDVKHAHTTYTCITQPHNTNYSGLSLETGAAEQIASSGILPTLAQTLRQKGSLTSQVTLLVAEMAREGKMSK